jgi:hypothetical protein
VRGLSAFLAAALLASLAPALRWSPPPAAPPDFPGWPTRFEGRTLAERPLSARDRRFAEGFPGRVRQYTDGSRTLVVRFVHGPTRRLHPALDCFRGAGYHVRPLPVRRGPHGDWGRFEASRGPERLLVSERIARVHGPESWSDVSSWYWGAVLGGAGPYWALTLVEPVP